MKEKSKKVLKGFGIGLMACAAIVGFTGCSNINVEQSQIDNLIASVETIKHQSYKMTREEVWNLAHLSGFNLMMNVDGVRDNMFMDCLNTIYSLEGDEIRNSSQEVSFYNFDGSKVQAMKIGNDLTLTYQLENNYTTQAEFIKTDIGGYLCTSKESSHLEFERVVSLYNGQGMPSPSGLGCDYEDLNCYEVLENGNVRLNFIKNYTYNDHREGLEDEYMEIADIITFEYDSKARLISIEENEEIVDISDNYSFMSELRSMKINVSYGTVDVEKITTWINLAEDYIGNQ